MSSNRGRGRGRVKPQQARRTHRLGGCSTCRRRHVKCDQTRPQCTTCRNAGLECGGFPSQIRWASMTYAPTKQPQVAENRVRRQFIRDELEQSAIIHSQSHDTVSQRSLSDSHHPDDRAPSVAYNASIPVATSSASNPGSVEDNPAFSPDGPDALVYSSAGFISDWESLFDTTNSLGWSDLFNSNSEHPMPDLGDQMYEDPLSLLAHVANHPPSDALPSELYTTSTMENQRSDKPFHGSASAGVRMLPLHSADNEMSESEILEDAQILLKHFKNVLIPQFSPLPMTAKSPWEILVCSAAVQTYADMTYLEGHNIKHARKANFFAILACSAHHITETQLIFDALPLERGLRVLEYASQRAKKHMQESLAFETSGPQRAKYKDQLMAIFSLIALATLRGNQSDARCYLIDAERLLRVRGLAKRELSRRARLLHHVYTWLRIIGESTFTLHCHSSSQLQSRIENSINRNRENSGEIPESEGNGAADKSSQLDDFLRVESHGTDSDSDLESSKDQEVGFRDIHLEDIRQWPKTLYMQIYGIPETWLSLVSQTTRLANVMDSLNRSAKQAPRTFSASLQRKIDRLEHMVCSLSAQHSVSVEPSFPTDSETSLGATTPNQSSASKFMLRALTSALVIFFYRRIRKVHPWILQGHVNDVITALKDFDLALSRSTQQGPGTPWAAFIAGCEAVSPVSRNWLLQWMEKGSKQSAFHGFTASQHIMREVWERRDAADKTTDNHSGSVGSHRNGSHKKSEICTWIDVLRSSNTWLMLY